MGTIQELEVKSLDIIDDRYAYFYCPTLRIGLSYRDGYTPHKPEMFSDQTRVEVPRLGFSVDIHFYGLGRIGRTNLCTKRMIDAYHWLGDVPVQWNNFLDTPPEESDPGDASVIRRRTTAPATPRG